VARLYQFPARKHALQELASDKTNRVKATSRAYPTVPVGGRWASDCLLDELWRYWMVRRRMRFTTGHAGLLMQGPASSR
jgi:hypothetical protein